MLNNKYQQQNICDVGEIPFITWLARDKTVGVDQEVTLPQVDRLLTAGSRSDVHHAASSQH